MSIWDEIEAEDNARLERVRREIAAEKAAWLALTPEQQAAHTAAVEAKYPDVPDVDEDDELEEDEE